MLVFENSGELDPRLITTIGVNVKPESRSPIGYFGTGLKYAIAVSLRLGCQIEVQSGRAEFRFVSTPVSIRGKEFQLISMLGASGPALELAFTTELGKNWLPWMAYRELWSNVQDEREGRVFETGTRPRAQEGLTRVIVSGGEIEAAHAERSTFILDTPVLQTLPSNALAVDVDVELHPGPGHGVFYRGLRVLETNKPSEFTYNILRHVTLTEDRTASSWECRYIIASALARCENEGTLEKVLAPLPGRWEEGLDWDNAFPTDTWKRVGRELIGERGLAAVNVSAQRLIMPGADKTVCPTCGREMP